MKITLGKNFLVDLHHKMGIVSDTPELQEDYKITQEQIDSFLTQLSKRGKSREIDIPDDMMAVVKGEMEDMAQIAWDNMKSEGVAAAGWASSIERQLEKIWLASKNKS